MQILQLEVPAEMVGVIAHHLVCSNMRNAWKLRGLCSTMEFAIEDDILLHQTKHVLKSGRKLMAHLSTRDLLQRVKKPLNCNDALPCQIADMHGDLCQELDYKDEKAEHECLEKLCRGIVKIMGNYWIFNQLWGYVGIAYIPIDLIDYKGLYLEHKLIASMTVQSYGTYSALHFQLSELCFQECEHCPLITAVAMEDDILVQITLDFLGALPKGKIEAWDTFGLWCALRHAMERKDVIKSMLILSGLNKTSIIPEKEWYPRWLRLCIEIENLELV